MGQLQKQESFGEISALLQAPFTCTVIAGEEVVLAVIEDKDLRGKYRRPCAALSVFDESGPISQANRGVRARRGGCARYGDTAAETSRSGLCPTWSCSFRIEEKYFQRPM